MLRACLGIAAAAVVVVVAGGCGRSSRIPVKGTVSINGQPLEAGDISFSPIAANGGPTAGAPIARGAYHVPAEQGLVAGEYKVQIHAFRKTGKKTWDGMGEPNAPASQKRYVEEMEQYVPSQYNDATDLKATVTAGKANDLKFDLKVAESAKGK
jgi:hypothetical protein